jgi:hypothetical protein
MAHDRKQGLGLERNPKSAKRFSEKLRDKTKG